MEHPEEILKAFEGPFGAPVSSESFLEAEMTLGHQLPALLKLHYAAYNGFVGPTNAKFFYPLEELVKHTMWLRGEGYFPKFIQHAVALGDYGVGPYWLILAGQPNVVVEWDAEMEGEERITLEGSLTSIWLERRKWYADVSGT